MGKLRPAERDAKRRADDDGGANPYASANAAMAADAMDDDDGGDPYAGAGDINPANEASGVSAHAPPVKVAPAKLWPGSAKLKLFEALITDGVAGSKKPLFDWQSGTFSDEHFCENHGKIDSKKVRDMIGGGQTRQNVISKNMYYAAEWSETWKAHREEKQK